MSSLRCGNGHDPTSLISANNTGSDTSIISLISTSTQGTYSLYKDFEGAYPSIDCLDYSTPTLIDNAFIPN